jgi:PAS domain-containing protein
LLGTILRQVAVSGITGTDLLRLRIPRLSLKKQRAIALILGTLDDKIELNRRMNETLEAIAQALFRSWFVDFDPVRVLSGQMPQTPPFLSAKALKKAGFPDRFQDSELGEIPKGWRVQQRHISDALQEASKALDASEERFRDLFDEAPIAYVHEGLDSRFIRANRTAMKILGIQPEDVPTTYGKTFVPNTPDAQRRIPRKKNSCFHVRSRNSASKSRRHRKYLR